jgi:amino acid transporter
MKTTTEPGTASTGPPFPADASAGPPLRTNALGFPQLLAQSVALISPTMTAVLILPLAYSIAADATWFSYAFATVMLLFTTLALNQFAKRSATTGSMYAYVARGLGAGWGVISGWALLWCYFFIGTAGLCGFALMSQQLLDAIGLNGTVPPYFFWLVSAAIGAYVAIKDVRLSAILMLLLEGLSMACILALGAVILFKHGFSVDTKQVTLHGFSLKGLDFSVVVCIFSLVGFEAASTMGGEARNPLKTVPKAVIWSLFISGGFMVVMAYVEVFGSRHAGLDLASLSAPLQTLSSAYDVSFFKIPVSLGAMVSFFALTLSCVNSGTRLVLPMARRGFISGRLHTTHSTNLTPHAAIGAYYVVLLAEVFVWHLMGGSVLTMFNDVGTLAATGFLFAYFAISIAAPVYLNKLGELRPSNVAVAVVGVLLLMVPAVGLFHPLPVFPVDIFPAIFAAYMIVGGLRLWLLSRSSPGVMSVIEQDLEAELEHGSTPASDIESGSRVGAAMPGLAQGAQAA